MAQIDCDWWTVRRKIRGVAGASQVMSGAPAPVYKKRIPYLRRRQATCNPGSTLQSQQRARWQYITWAWSNVLTPQERADWNDFALYVFTRWHDEEQQYRILNGFQWFCGLNGRVLRAGLPLLVNSDDFFPGEPLDTMDFTFLSSTSIRVTFSPDEWFYRGLLIYGRGPDSPGTTHVVPDANWVRESVPSRWYFIGFGGEEAASPNDFTLPREVLLGRKLAIIGCLMTLSGGIGADWLVEQHVRT